MVVVGRDRRFGKVAYAKKAIESIVEASCCGLLWINDGRSFPTVKWFKASCEFVSTATEVLVSSEVN